MLKIIISPAKKMMHQDDVFFPSQLPIFLEEATEIKAHLLSKSYDERKTIWACNDKIAQLNSERLEHMNLTTGLTPAVLAYVGLQFQYMAPQVFDYDQWDYVQAHLFILSGFYGLLNAADGVTPYRLEMQAKFSINGAKNLYDYWKNLPYEALSENATVIVNLASVEYSKIIEKYLAPHVLMVTITFAECVVVNGEKTFKTKATAAKMARGEMVRFMAEHQIKEVAHLKKFDRLSYTYCGEKSTDTNYVFIKELD